MIEDSIVLQVWLFVMLLVFFACKMKGFCRRFLKSSINIVIFIIFFVLLHLIKRIRV
ncbi:Uncharacterised protein [Segatella copri]|nr:Uncharacterised protein [Segatella copri]